MKSVQLGSLKEVYGIEFCGMMHCFVANLNEKQRRLFLGLEASRLGHGGRRKIVEEFSTTFGVIQQGERELLNPELLPEPGRVRRPGGGCKLTEEANPDVLEALKKIMQGHIAGDPMNEQVRWTDLRLSQIREALEEEGFRLSDKTVKRLVKKTTRSKSRSRKRR